jgi:uncharacterized membrane-anchored protein
MKEKNNYHQNERLRITIIISILLALAGVFLLYAAWPLLTGKTIMLETKPIDSSNIIQNKYLRIEYNVNTIPKIPEAKIGQEVYISLEKSSKGYWEYHSASLEKPKEKEVFIIGKIILIDGNNMNVQYGIEQYFLKPNSKIPSRTFQVEITISRDGRARIDDIQFMGGPTITKNLSISS